VWRHHREDHGGLIRLAFERRGATVSEELVGATSSPSSLENVDVLVILGSSESVYDPSVTWLDREMSTMTEAIARGVRVFGICFGAQMLCAAFGGSVVRAPRGELGWVEIESRVSGISRGPWFEYHDDHCILPDSAVVLASSDLCVQAFAIGRNVGVQFHPEVDESQLQDWFANDADAQRRGADVEGFLNIARHSGPSLVTSADDLVAHFLGELN
jgi:GMP synthase-like glutamine amidotransferase